MCYFSVIMPVYNAEERLSDTLDSLLNQTFIDFEVIMVNDGSKDSSKDICNQYVSRDKRFKLFNQENSGVSKTRNNAISYSNGEYIVFLDSDDQYDKDYLITFYNTIKEYSDFDNYWCGFNIIKGKDVSQNTKLESKDVTIATRDNIMTLHSQWMDSTLWNKCFKAKIIKDNNLIMDESLSLGEDLLFNFSYLDIADTNIVIINKYLYNYYQFNEGSLDTKYRKDLYDIYEKIYSKVLVYLHKWNLSEDELSKYYDSVYFNYEKVLRNTFCKESDLSRKEKYKYNNSILKSNKFIETLNKSSCFIHPLYRKAYKTKNYLFVQLVDKLVELKNKR